MSNDNGGGGGTGNPYAEQTAANTSPAWLDGGPTVDVDLDGLGEYARHMQTAQLDLLSRAANLSHLSSMPMSAWEGTVLGEADYVRHTMLENANELSQYLMHLGTALNNIGMAAQTVADIYSSSDGTSAASLDAVLFAFGNKDVPRPAGLPSTFGKTYWDQQFEDAAAGTTPIGADSEMWRHGSTIHATSYLTIDTATGPNGQRLERSTLSTPNGTEVTTTIYARDGSVLSRTREVSTTQQQGNTTVNTRTTYDGDRPTGRTEERTTRDSSGDVTRESTTSYDGSGNRTGTTTTTTDGDQVQTTTRVNARGEVTDEVTVGPQTEGSVTAPASPAQQASEDLPDMYLR